MRARLDGQSPVLPGPQAREAGHRDHRRIVGAELDARIVHARPVRAAAAFKCSRRVRLAPTPPETTSAVSPVYSSARSALA